MHARYAIVPGLLLLLAVACRSGVVAPDLGSLYTKSARYHGAERNPIIVIPGLLGSRLIDSESGQVVWGAFGGGAANPKSGDGARLLALPMARGAALHDLHDQVVPDGVLDRVRVRILGLPMVLEAYMRILFTLGVGGYRDEAVDYGGVDYGTDHFTCFQFDYDWRRDNVESAARLLRFIEEKRADVLAEYRRRGVERSDVRFDVVAHSQGALVLRYFLRYGDADLPADGSLPPLTWAGAAHVERAILVAPPNAGAVDTLIYLTAGRKFGPLTPRYPAVLIGTMPGAYQLLPRARHRVLVSGDQQTALDPLDGEVWRRHRLGLAAPSADEVLVELLPAVKSADERRAIALDHLDKSLARARQFQNALDLPSVPPASTGLYLIAGDAELTPRRLSVGADGRLTVVAQDFGDGTVLRSSALMDEREDGSWMPWLRSPIDWRQVIFLFRDHLGLTKDAGFSDNVLYLLLEDPRGEAD